MKFVKLRSKRESGMDSDSPNFLIPYSKETLYSLLNDAKRELSGFKRKRRSTICNNSKFVNAMKKSENSDNPFKLMKLAGEAHFIG